MSSRVPWNKGKPSPKMLGNSYASKGAAASRNAGNRRAQKIMAPVKNCAECGEEKESFQMVVHHVDGDTLNNALSNLVKLCRSCHINLHREELTYARFYRGK